MRDVADDRGSIGNIRRRYSRDLDESGAAPVLPHGEKQQIRENNQSQDIKELDGGARGSRTPDLLNAIQALSQLSYGPDGDQKSVAGSQRAQSISVAQIV
jgi:hypothetical protein